MLLVAPVASSAHHVHAPHALGGQRARKRLVDTTRAHHRRRTALVEQTLERLSHLFAHDDHPVAATCGQARPRKLRIAGIARLKRAGGVHRGARAAAHALRRVHHKPVVDEGNAPRRARLGALQARHVSIAHLGAALLAHADRDAVDARQHAYDAATADTSRAFLRRIGGQTRRSLGKGRLRKARKPR